jgi:hypothetical protein
LSRETIDWAMGETKQEEEEGEMGITHHHRILAAIEKKWDKEHFNEML